MANAAPFMARPMRRLIAGVIDVWICLFVFSLGGVTTSINGESNPLELLVHNKGAFIVYAAYHAVCFLSFRGATAGLYLADIRIVNAATGADMSRLQMLGRAAFRPAFLYLFWWSSSFAPDVPGADTGLVIAPLLVELAMMFTLPTRQTLTDLIARTLVVNMPPPQPHRAPAAPMYSPSDAEFGVRPSRRK
jgi:uncharacterized RDD family membrane protein YckC